MARIARSDVHAALMRAAQHLKDAAGDDGKVSKADLKAKLGELSGTERNMVDSLFFLTKLMKSGPTVTKKDIDQTLAYAKDQLVDKFDLNHNGLSQSEIARMDSVGKLAVQLGLELRMAAAIGGDDTPPIVAMYGIRPPDVDVDPPIVAMYGIRRPDVDVNPPIVAMYGIRQPDVDVSPPIVAMYGIRMPDVDENPPIVALYGIRPAFDEPQ